MPRVPMLFLRACQLVYCRKKSSVPHLLVSKFPAIVGESPVANPVKMEDIDMSSGAAGRENKFGPAHFQ